MLDPCIDIPTPQYLSLSGAITFPTAIQITEAIAARWLMVKPGVANQAGTTAPGGLEWRLYKGILLPGVVGSPPWKTGYILGVNPWAVGNFLNADVIPWGDLLEYVVEINGVGTWGAGSAFDLTLSPFTPQGH